MYIHVCCMVCVVILQALAEFTSLCQREPLESVKSVLTVWSLMYNKLSLVCLH